MTDGLELAMYEGGDADDLLISSPEDEAYAAYHLNHTIFNELYNNYSQDLVRSISKMQRNSFSLHSSLLSYSEIGFEPFGELLIRVLYNSGVEMKRFKKFVDIGSGCGKLVFAAYFTSVFVHCSGIEILSSLHDFSCNVRKDYMRRYLESDETFNVEFINGDATVVDWSDTNVAFAYATGFNSITMHRISAIAQKMKPGSIFISVTQRLPNSVYFDLLQSSEIPVSWGTASVFVHKRNKQKQPEEENNTLDRVMAIVGTDE